jgi:hypothetical protein
MTFARSWRAKEMNRLVTIDEAKLCQGKDAVPIKGRLEGKVETSKGCRSFPLNLTDGTILGSTMSRDRAELVGVAEPGHGDQEVPQ